MFLSKRRNVVVSQSEHARFAGTIAAYWGNTEIPPPVLPREAFALGVMSHDRGYGSLDSLGIGQVDDSVWLATQSRGVHLRSPDPVTDTVALMHIRRLVSGRKIEGVKNLVELIENAIDENLERVPEDRSIFQQADTVTEACDIISFQFCFEDPMQFVHTVASGSESRDINIVIDDTGRVELEPWPLSVPELHGCVLAYSADGYPDLLSPLLLPYEVVPAFTKAQSRHFDSADSAIYNFGD